MPKNTLENGKCPDGATNEEHDTALAEIGQCPWCGLMSEPNPDPYNLVLDLLDA